MEHEPFDYINKYDTAILKKVSEFILNEHPQTIALICLHLENRTIKEIFDNFPPDLTSEVIMRMTRVTEVSSKIISTVDAILKKRLKYLDDLKLFDVNITIDKLEDTLISMKDNNLRDTLETINQVDVRLFSTLTKKISVDNPERLL